MAFLHYVMDFQRKFRVGLEPALDLAAIQILLCEIYIS